MESMKGVFQGFDIAAAGLRADMRWAEVVAGNISNMHITHGANGEPYRRHMVVFQEVLSDAMGSRGQAVGQAGGVRIARVVEDTKTPFPARYEPGHPDADENGWVRMSNVNLFKELVDLSVIERSYQANLAALRIYRTMLQQTMNNLRS